MAQEQEKFKKERLKERETQKFQDNVDDKFKKLDAKIKELEERIEALETP